VSAGDGFVTKLSPTGSSLVYSTYLGGTQDEYCNAIAVDSAGSAYVAGATASSDFPVQAGYQATFQGGSTTTTRSDAFVTKLTPDGSGLVYSTYLGGNSYDGASGIAVDNSGSAYVGGTTTSCNFPTTSGAYQTTCGSGGFVAKFAPAGGALAYSTYFTGMSSLAIDSSGSAYLGSINLSKLTPAADAVVYSTYLGGSGSDAVYGIAVDSAGSVYVTGSAGSSDFPTQSAYQATLQGSSDAFVAKLAGPYTTLGISMTSTNLIMGQSGAFSMTVKNSNAAPTSGTVTVTDILPSGLTLLSMSGAKWSCSGTTCTRSDALAPGATYDPIVLAVNVPSSAPSSVTNKATVSGGGTQAAWSASLTGGISKLPAWSISKTHTGNFTQGQTNASYSITVSNIGYAGSGGQVYVYDTLPAGLTAAGVFGADPWNCTLSTVSCTRSDALAAGASYSPITVFVNVGSAPPIVTNQARVNGGGTIAATTATDQTNVGITGPSVVSIVPGAGGGKQQTFRVTAADVAGRTLSTIVLLINSTLTGSNGCFVSYDVASNSLSLANNTVTAWFGPSAVGSGPPLSNSQCTVSPAGASVTTSGGNLTVSIPVSFAFGGAETTWGYVADTTQANSGYLAMGTWNVPNSPLTAKVAVFNSSQGNFLEDASGNFAWDGAPPDYYIGFGLPNYSPRYVVVMGDWNGTGTLKLGLFDPSTAQWSLDYAGIGTLKTFYWGSPGDIPVVGDWNGSGTTKVGTVGPNTGLWLLDYNGNFVWDGTTIDRYFAWGSPGDTPVVGDWNGSGTAKAGTFGPKTGLWLLDYNGNFTWDGSGVDKYFPWGSSGDTPVVGDWNGSGTSKAGTFGPGTGLWLLDYNGNFSWDGPSVDKYFPWGSPGDTPVVGDWNGNGTSKVGTFGSGTGLWLLDYNGNFKWDGASVDKYFPWGSPGDTPAVVK
jgi:uncharacterized repeat protein (TIGR01451 family)